jgi:hypothetical protein
MMIALTPRRLGTSAIDAPITPPQMKTYIGTGAGCRRPTPLSTRKTSRESRGRRRSCKCGRTVSVGVIR